MHQATSLFLYPQSGQSGGNGRLSATWWARNSDGKLSCGLTAQRRDPYVLHLCTTVGHASLLICDAKNPGEWPVPPAIRGLLRWTRRIELDRLPLSGRNAFRDPEVPLRGMSPKKSHEVLRMVNYVEKLVSTPELRDVLHIVDVGAGQGYLARALYNLGFHVLALDSDSSQTKGAERRNLTAVRPLGGPHSPLRDNQPKSDVPRGSLSHRTVHITPASLRKAVSGWIAETPLHTGSLSSDGGAAAAPVPILFVALHACGTLTPDIFRMLVSCDQASQILSGGPCARNQGWIPAGAVAVGCCYNLMEAEDFPLSREYSCLPHLTSAHFQLAAQIPARWLDTPQTAASAELSIKKVVYRALLEPFLSPATQPGTGPASSASRKRLGRLNDNSYDSFPHFLSRAFSKMGILLPSSAAVDGVPTAPEASAWAERRQRQLEVLHVLRCIVGPSIETAILCDRLVWLREALGQQKGKAASEMTRARHGWKVELVNLFDQTAGSARNFAIVMRPCRA
ncbi:methyltransferase domain-containing protein [Vararia minispora EC-137]|uniref:Methyltransferase domain-containing protein n=1 Tax=Vararia minispora EC-137 TaxID=1314806 RepID=A0ACB8QSU9_9AGAM|nr:methyltransferase domain-containing protein [Vararia minispora EC-137]